MFKFELDQTIYYLNFNKVHRAPVLARMIVENRNNDDMFGRQAELFQPFGTTRTVYATCHGIVDSAEAFESLEALAMHIIGCDQ